MNVDQRTIPRVALRHEASAGQRNLIEVVCSPVTKASSDIVAGLLDFLNTQERARMEQFRRSRDSIAYAQAHLLLRGCLWRATGRWDWPFAVSSMGKPKLANTSRDQRLDFNLTHSAAMVACVLAIDAEVGVDAELDYCHSDGRELANEYFAPEESKWLKSRYPGTERSAFSSVWAMKEAVLKATGCGLHGNLREFAVDIESQSVHFGNGLPDSHRTWRVESRRYETTNLAVAARSAVGSNLLPEFLWRCVAPVELAQLFFNRNFELPGTL